MSEKTKARQLAEKVEFEGRFGPDTYEEDSDAIDKYFGKGNPVGSVARGVIGSARSLGKAAKAVVGSRPKRTDEEMGELTREVSKGMKNMKSGGKVSSASKRADGIAQRGKTKGRMV